MGRQTRLDVAQALAIGQLSERHHPVVLGAAQGANPLVGAETDRAAKAEIHEHVMDGGVMSMQRVGTLEVPPRAATDLEPGGLQVMLMGLDGPLVEGETFIL